MVKCQIEFKLGASRPSNAPSDGPWVFEIPDDIDTNTNLLERLATVFNVTHNNFGKAGIERITLYAIADCSDNLPEQIWPKPNSPKRRQVPKTYRYYYTLTLSRNNLYSGIERVDTDNLDEAYATILGRLIARKKAIPNDYLKVSIIGPGKGGKISWSKFKNHMPERRRR